MGQAQPLVSIPPSTSPLFLIGRNSHGSWVAQDERGLRGGLFVDRAEALRFALFENGHRPQAVIMVPGILELDMTPKASPHAAVSADAPAQRHAA